jgi:superfamily II DNA/RNA helicase
MSSNLSPHQAKYFAHELTRLASAENVDRLTQSLFDAAVDLNPHQIDAALFALQKPLSKGVMLADEVGLGKTIEAGILLCQLWAERRRRLLVICPASLRKQWAIELEEKFSLSSIVLDAREVRRAEKDGVGNPFDRKDAVVIVSLNFASRMADRIKVVQWDLVIIDEAHKLRNSYRPSNRMGQNIRWALEDRRKVLLTATPLQNSLMELYGLASLIDDRTFGDERSFRSQYTVTKSDLEDLRLRLSAFCKRTLRRDVLEYIRYTERNAITVPFRPSDDEQRIYDAVSTFLLRDNSYAIPQQQKQLTTLILRKLLASSSLAIAGTLDTMVKRLTELKQGLSEEDDLLSGLIESEELESDYLDDGSSPEDDASEPSAVRTLDFGQLDWEIDELARYASWAREVGVDTKSRTLLTALETGFDEMAKMGAERKALIFTESRRTQNYLTAFLSAHGYDGEIVAFSGSNADPVAKTAYSNWLDANRGTGRVTGSRQVDMRTALVEHFRLHAKIMIATEAAAEGINLQFCSLVINYDMPWNPQRVEQRIGRCHRYGQKHDVVVINFLNERNAADRRVFELLDEKFNLFRGVFGASDEVLGTIESGVDFEKRILSIYQDCRTPHEIDAAFAALRQEMDESIQARMKDTRRALLEHFDEDVHTRLRLRLDHARARIDRVSHMFWELTKLVLSDRADFDDEALHFLLDHPPSNVSVPKGVYYLSSKDRTKDDYVARGLAHYRLGHPLGEYVLDHGKALPTESCEVVFDITRHPTRIAVVEALIGQAGWLRLDKLSVEALDRQEFLLFTAITDTGEVVDQEVCERMMSVAARTGSAVSIDNAVERTLIGEADRRRDAAIAEALERNDRYFDEERARLEKWAEDMIASAEKELSDTKAQIKDLGREARKAATTEEQHELQTRIRDLEKRKRRLRERIFDVEDEIAEKRDSLITDLEKRMVQRSERETLFQVRWRVA